MDQKKPPRCPWRDLGMSRCIRLHVSQLCFGVLACRAGWTYCRLIQVERRDVVPVEHPRHLW